MTFVAFQTDMINSAVVNI